MSIRCITHRPRRNRSVTRLGHVSSLVSSRRCGVGGRRRRRRRVQLPARPNQFFEWEKRLRPRRSYTNNKTILQQTNRRKIVDTASSCCGGAAGVCVCARRALCSARLVRARRPCSRTRRRRRAYTKPPFIFKTVPTSFLFFFFVRGPRIRAVARDTIIVLYRNARFRLRNGLFFFFLPSRHFFFFCPFVSYGVLCAARHKWPPPRNGRPLPSSFCAPARRRRCSSRRRAASGRTASFYRCNRRREAGA